MKFRVYHLFALLLTSFVFSFTFPSASESSAADPPNVLFLICDDLNCDIGCYGHRLVKTPNLDALAARGTRFTNAYCQYPLCGPSRACFMSGWYPDQTFIRSNAIHLRERAPSVNTMSQHFRDAGYYALRIGKIYHYNVPKHIGTGGHDDPYSWNQTINPIGRDVFDEDKIFSLRPGSFGGTLSWLAADGDDEEQTDGIAAAEAIKQLRRFSDSGQPFFMAVGLYRPHTPYVAPKKYFDLYPVDGIQVPTVPDGYYDTLPKPAVASIRRKKEQVDLDPRLAKQAIQAYYASITFADAQVGQILDALKTNGMADNTIVLFTSDHGYHMGEHGHYQKTTLFENATHVPLIMAGPGVTRGGVAKTMAEMVDFYPTLADLAGLTIPESVSGVSLTPALSDPAATVRTSAFSQYATGYSIRTSDYRLTRWGEDGKNGWELYDHALDADEMHNVADEPKYAAVRDQLAAELERRVTDANRTPPGKRTVETKIPRQVEPKK